MNIKLRKTLWYFTKRLETMKYINEYKVTHSLMQQIERISCYSFLLRTNQCDLFFLFEQEPKNTLNYNISQDGFKVFSCKNTATYRCKNQPTTLI